MACEANVLRKLHPSCIDQCKVPYAIAAEHIFPQLPPSHFVGDIEISSLRSCKNRSLIFQIGPPNQLRACPIATIFRARQCQAKPGNKETFGYGGPH